MKKTFTTMMFAALFAVGTMAQNTATPEHDKTNGKDHCLAQADESTWSDLGLNDEQIERVQAIKDRYNATNEYNKIPGSQSNTMRDRIDDRATDTPTGRGQDRETGNVDTDRRKGNADTDRRTGTTGTDTHGTTATGRTTDELGYDDTYDEAMERELQTVLTNEQYDRYKAWCQDQDNMRGDSNTDMDR